MSISCQKSLFTLDEDITYINCAYMSPMLKSVEEVGHSGINQKRSPNHVTATDFFENSEKLRSEFAKLINASNPSDCAIIASVSYGIATVAKNIELNRGEEILVLEEQFPSNYYSWDRKAKEAGAHIITVDPQNDSERGGSWNENILNAINSRTKVIAMPHVHWADGTKFDLVKIRNRADEVGAYLIIDGTQSVGALPFDVQEIKPDALICAGYKWLLGPYSLGMAFYGERFKDGVPIEENWKNRFDSANFAGLVSYEERYMEGSLRFDVGEHSNFILTPMLLKSIEQLNTWTPAGIQEYCREIVADSVEKLLENGFVIETERFRSSHLFGIRMKGKDVEEVRRKLEANRVFVSIRGDAVRVSPHVYNIKEDMERLANILIEC